MEKKLLKIANAEVVCYKNEKIGGIDCYKYYSFDFKQFIIDQTKRIKDSLNVDAFVKFNSNEKATLKYHSGDTYFESVYWIIE